MKQPPKLALLASLYITQYIPIGFFFAALPAIMRQRGASLEQIGAVYVLGLPWLLKFLWSPLVDRYGSARLGHYRGWLLAMQGLMVVSLILLIPFDVIADFGLVLLGCAFFCICAATQDIAADALAVRLLGPEERGLGNGVQMAGGLVGNLLGGGAVLIAYRWVGWAGSMVVMAVAVALPLLLVLLFKERYVVARADGEERASMKTLVRFFRRPRIGRWVVVLLLYWAGISLGYGLITPMLVDIGWDLDKIGLATNVVGGLLGIGVALLAGALIRRLARKAALAGFQALQALLLAALFIPALGVVGDLPNFVAASIAMASYSMAAVAVSTAMMDRSRAGTAGVDYTLQYCLGSLTSFLATGVGTALAGRFGYAVIVAAAIGLSALSALSVVWLFTPAPRVDEAML